MEQTLTSAYPDLEFTHAASGAMTLMELITLAEVWSQKNEKIKLIALYRLWLEKSDSPLAYAAYFNLGVLLTESGDREGAEKAYREAVRANPMFCQAYLNLGTVLELLKRPAEALAQWRHVLTLLNLKLPDDQGYSLHALNNLGRLEEIEKHFEEAEAWMKQSLLQDPKQPNTITHWVHLRQKQCKWPAYQPFKGLTKEDMVNSTSALAMLSATGDPKLQLNAAQRFIKEKVISDVARLSPAEGYSHERLRIGYLSSDFCAHAVSILTAELYELHDRQKVEVYAFSWSREDGTPMRKRVVDAMDHYIRIDSMSDPEAAACIRSHEIDILVDLQGLTSGARPNIIAFHPAPVQITYIGFPGTTAQPGIDYVLADKFIIPEELTPYFTEKPLYMPNCFQINDRQRKIGPCPSRSDCGLPESAFVFCSFNNNFKITPEVFDSWMKILKQVPDSVLWLVSDHNIVRTNLWKVAEMYGISKDRVIFAERVVPDQYLARYQVADLFLDTPTFNAGTTGSDALWAGLPILTCPGKTFASRMAGSLLMAVDLPELIADSVTDYEKKAVAYANNRPRIAEIKKKLEDERLTNSLFNSPQFVRDLEMLYAQVAIGAKPADLRNVPVKKTAQIKSKISQPMVSILIPTHNRPIYFEAALKSAVVQAWDNLEIIVSDNSDDELTAQLIQPYLKKYPKIRYSRVPGRGALENFQNCYALSQGEYINFLMDDDLFHPEKIQTMMGYMLTQPNVGLVTSFRQLIDADGKYMNPIPGTERLFQIETVVGGASLGNMILTNGQNIIGEPTTALFRKSDIGHGFGMFHEKQYTVLSDVATWLSILNHKDCIYVPDALSFFRIHGEQDQRSNNIKIKANIEWLQLLCDALDNGNFLHDQAVARDLLTSKLVTCIWFLSSVHEEIKNGCYPLEKIQRMVQQATNIMLSK